jgi:hypothetical protein
MRYAYPSEFLQIALPSTENNEPTVPTEPLGLSSFPTPSMLTPAQELCMPQSQLSATCCDVQPSGTPAANPLGGQL